MKRGARLSSAVATGSSTAGTPPLSLGHPAALLATLVAAACVLISVSFRLYDADMWQNLAFGRAVWTLRSVPHRQLFAWPSYGAPLVNPSWGFTALIWPFWTLGGVTGLFVWRWLTTLAALAVLWLTARRLGARGLVTLLALVVCALVYRQRSQIRPETLAAVWFAIVVWILETRRQAGPDHGWWLVAIACAWANTHISYYLGFLLVGIHLIDALVGRGGAAGPGRAARLGWMGLAMVGASLVNPYGWHALARPFEYLLVWRNEPIMRTVSELKPIDWSVQRANGLPVLMVLWPLLALLRVRRPGIDRVEWMMCAVFTVLGLSSGRFVATYALAAAPYVARDLDERVRGWRRPRWTTPAWGRAAIISAACVATCWTEWTRYQGPLGIGLDLRHSPMAACDFMAAHGVRGRGFNHFYQGGTLMWRFWPDRERLPFMTGSPEDSPREVRTAYYAAVTSPEGWSALDARYHFDYALMSRRYIERYGLLDLLDADPGWAPVFIDDVAAVYVRRRGTLAAVADSFGYRLLSGGRTRLAQVVQQAGVDRVVRATLIAELERQARTTNMNFYGRQLLRAITAGAPR